MTSKGKGDTMTRRGFLRNSALIGGAAAAGSLVGQASAGVEQPTRARSGTGRKQGYHETPHIREYYDKARF